MARKGDEEDSEDEDCTAWAALVYLEGLEGGLAMRATVEADDDGAYLTREQLNACYTPEQWAMARLRLISRRPTSSDQ